MPVKFACEHCGQRLSVSSDKIGKRAKCPKCREPIQVPNKEDAAKSLDKYADKADADESGDEDPFSQFVVYDDAELVYESEPTYTAKSNAAVDTSKIAVPRIALYVQGVLLGVVAVSFFMFGILVGSKSTKNENAEEAPKVCVVTGSVTYRDGADSGAVVIFLPKGKRPDERPSPTGLRPNDVPPPTDANIGYRAIVENGGGYARTNAQGDFKIRVDNLREYYVLFISRRGMRDDDEELTRAERSEIAGYFDSVTDLIGQNQFRWLTAQTDGGTLQFKEIKFN